MATLRQEREVDRQGGYVETERDRMRGYAEREIDSGAELTDRQSVYTATRER